jgi:hypothetical protein
MPRLAMGVRRPDLEPLLTKGCSQLLRSDLLAVTTRTRRRDSRQAVRKLCEVDAGGALRIRHDPPLILRFEAYEGRGPGEMSWQEWVDHAVKRYKESLCPEIRLLLSRFHVCDVALMARPSVAKSWRGRWNRPSSPSWITFSSSRPSIKPGWRIAS